MLPTFLPIMSLIPSIPLIIIFRGESFPVKNKLLWKSL